MSEETPLSDVEVAEGKQESGCGTPHNEHDLSEQEVAVLGEPSRYTTRGRRSVASKQ